MTRELTAAERESFALAVKVHGYDPRRQCPLCTSWSLYERVPGFGFCSDHYSWQLRVRNFTCRSCKRRWSVRVVPECCQKVVV